MDIPNGSRRWFSWSNHVVRRRNGCRLQKRLEPRRPEDEEIMIPDVARITQLVGSVARRHETVAWFEDERFGSDDDLQFSGEYKVRFILMRMRMAGHTHPGRETWLEEAIRSAGVLARQTHRADAHVKVGTLGSRLIFDQWSSVV